jgi:phage major head subunit gpT-like protein
MGQLSVFDSRDVIGSFRKAYADSIDGSWSSSLATRVDTDKETETYRWLGSAPPLREWLGYRLYQAVQRYTMSITNVKYEASLRFDLDDLRRTVKSGNQIPVVLSEMAAKAAKNPERLLTTLIINGDTTTSGLAYDGQQFFDTDHSEGASGTQKNDLTSSEIPAANVTTTTAPTATEWANTLLQTIGYMYGLVDDQGDPINGDARNFVVMVGTASLYSGLVQAIGLNALASGADNPLRAMSGINITPILNPRRSAATAEFNIFRTDGNVKPFVHQVEVPLTTSMVGAGSETEFEEDAHKFGIKVVEGTGYGYWQHAAEVTFD